MKRQAAQNESGDARARILAVEDSPSALAALNRILSQDYVVLQAGSGQQALEVLRLGGVSMVISDVFLPELSGLALLAAMKADERLRAIPVIMLTADGNTDNEIEALRLGAVDIVRKPIVSQILLARVQNFLTLQASFHAMEENLKNQQRLRTQAEALRTAEHDELTGVLTRQAFHRHVRNYLDRHPTQTLEIIRFDVDNFSTINDLMGVKAGDRLLRSIGRGIQSLCDTSTDLLVAGHIEADHFAVLHNPSKRSAEELFVCAQDWLAKNESECRPNGRFGVYPIIDASVDPAVMCDRALLALRSIKGNYSKRIAYYDDSMRQKLLEEMRLTEEMLPALKSGQFEVYYQPQVNYFADELIGAEALVRWNHPQKGLLSPAVFLPLFERNGQIVELDNFVWETVCRQLADWRTRFGQKIPPVSVNISRMDTYGEDLHSRLTGLTDQYEIPRELLRLEITESAYVCDAQRLCEIVERLSAAGFTIEMDDFGSAYSSLNMLKDIPVDILKLDMKFLSDTKNSARGGNILSSVVRMARWLKLPTIAEGVETKQQADYLNSIGCLYMQGYYFSKPIPVTEYEVFLQGRTLGGTDKYRNTDISAAESFWDASTQTALIFNSYVGGAVILQRTGDKLEMLRANDEFFRVIHIAREDYLSSTLNVWQRFVKGEQRAYNEMLDKASRGDAVAECDLCSLTLDGKAGDWTRNRAKLLAKNGDSEIFYVSVENITAEKAAQEELARQKDMLYQLYNGVPCGIVDYRLIDGRLQMVNCNDTAWQINGYANRLEFESTYGQMRGRSMIHPDDLPPILEQVHAALSHGEPITAECRMERKDHSFYWAEIRLQCYFNSDPVTLQSVFMNIDDRREQETQKYSKLLYSIFDEVFLWNYQENTCQTIKSATSHTRAGERREGLCVSCEAWIAEHVHAEDQSAVRKFITRSHLQRACAGDTIPYVEYRVLLPNKKTALTRASAYSVDENRFMICCRNVTREKQAAEQAKQIAVLQAKLEEQARYRIIVEQTGAAVIEWNHKSGEFFHSGTYGNYEMSRCDPVELIHNQARLTTVYEPDVPALQRFFTESKSGKPSAEAVLRLRMTDGSFRWTRMRGDFLFDGNGEPVRTIGTLTDIDNEMRAKETLRETNARLENIIANIPAGVGIYRMDPDQTVVPLYISDRACQIFGFTREEYDARIASGLPVHFMPDLNILSPVQLEAARAGKSISVSRIRAKKKDGSWFWLRLTCSFVANGKEPSICYATLSDVSHLVEAEQTADSVKELYQLLIESTETITLDYSVAEDVLQLSFMGKHNLREETRFADYLNRLQSGESFVVPSSQPELVRVLRAACRREMHGELDICALDPDGEKHWYHIKFLSLSEDGTVYRIVGRADNFDDLARHQEARLKQAQIDRVTGLLGKDSARAVVEERLRSRPAEQLDAILFLDVDNFKRVNDTEGHLEGDRVLAKVAKILKKNFRTSDIVARFGGDEFLIYMVAPQDRQAILDKAQRILDSVHAISAHKPNVLGCSIGITEVTGAMRDFDAVFRCADHAMYLAKQSGKNQFAIC